MVEPQPQDALATDAPTGDSTAHGGDAPLQAVRVEVARTIVGQEALITRLLVALLCDGHCLLEGVPGLAKSLAVQTLADAIQAQFVRIQFTPDLLPADLTGTEIYNARSGGFDVRRGPIFANIVLADEINRAPAKVQSALLEAMQERQISIGGETFPLPDPFMVLATQNPIEHEGTYRLPEAQLDRFMLKVIVDYPGERDEREILERHLRPQSGPLPTARLQRGRSQPVLSTGDLLAARTAVEAVLIEDPVRDYVVRLIRGTRHLDRIDGGLEHLVQYGASPRAAVFLAQAARAHAFLDGRTFTAPEDVKAMAPDVLRHRVLVSYEAEAEDITSDQIITRILDGVTVR